MRRNVEVLSRRYSLIKADRWSTGQVSSLTFLDKFMEEDEVLRTTAMKLTAHNPERPSSILQVPASPWDLADVAVGRKASRSLQDRVDLDGENTKPPRVKKQKLSVLDRKKVALDPNLGFSVSRRPGIPLLGTASRNRKVPTQSSGLLKSWSRDRTLPRALKCLRLVVSWIGQSRSTGCILSFATAPFSTASRARAQHRPPLVATDASRYYKIKTLL